MVSAPLPSFSLHSMLLYIAGMSAQCLTSRLVSLPKALPGTLLVAPPSGGGGLAWLLDRPLCLKPAWHWHAHEKHIKQPASWAPVVAAMHCNGPVLACVRLIACRMRWPAPECRSRRTSARHQLKRQQRLRGWLALAPALWAAMSWQRERRQAPSPAPRRVQCTARAQCRHHVVDGFFFSIQKCCHFPVCCCCTCLMHFYAGQVLRGQHSSHG